MPAPVIGIPRALGFYENFPFWRTLLTRAGFAVRLSAHSNHDLAAAGLHTVMSDNICYPAKLMNGHILDLLSKNVSRILLPHIVRERKTPGDPGSAFNCPVVAGYADVVRSAINPQKRNAIPLDTPAVNLSDPVLARRSIEDYLTKTLNVPAPRARAAFNAAWTAQGQFQAELAARARHLVETAEAENRLVLLLAGRPYHNDPLIQHKIADAVTSLGAVVITEDIAREAPLDVPDLSSMQWCYTHRILSAARWVAAQGPAIHFVQLTSFGCGLDPFITETASEILNAAGKHLTLLKVDDVNNTGSLRLRLRSLVESLRGQPPPRQAAAGQAAAHHPVTENTFHPDHTILVPFMSEFYSPLVEPLMRIAGYKVQTLPPPDAAAAEFGIQHANNEVCYPATLVVGSFIKALASNTYDHDKIALGITQTGGQCRASSYIDIIRRALRAAGLAHIPVLPIAATETTSARQPAFKPNWRRAATTFLAALCYGDNLSQLHHATAPREKLPGQAAALRDHYMAAVLPLVAARDLDGMARLLRQAAADHAAALDPARPPAPKIGVVGEIYVKLNAFSQSNAVNWLIAQGVE
ncbi:MAG: acyl-CoA dehydratase activase-related protein, partial [Opitutaceae bacterium]|nr:acyl-CoA dehydratase activase-related protein [Opitutaceae bacterium]